MTLEWTAALSVGLEEIDFGAEESAMRAVRYPGYHRHKAEHDRFIGDLVAFAEEHERLGPSAFLAVKASAWLSEWLRAHVSGTDAEMARFLRRETV